MQQGRLHDRLAPALYWLVLALALLMPLARRGVTIVSSLVLLLWLLQGGWRRRWQVVRSSRMMVALAVFLGLNLLSLTWSAHPLDGLDYLSKYRYLLLVPALATSLPLRRIGTAIDALLLGTGLSLVWSYGIYFGLIRFGKGYPEHAAPSMSHLDYSMFVAAAALLALVRLVRRPLTPVRRAGWTAFFLFAVVGLLINIGRSGQLAFFVTLVVLVASYLPGPRLLRAGGAVALTALLLLGSYAAIPIFRGRVDSAVSEVRLALTEQQWDTNQGKRIAGMIVAAAMLRHDPLLGTGVGDVMEVFHRTAVDRYPQLAEAVAQYRHLHNEYLQVACELGLVGLVALLALFLALLCTRTGSGELNDVALVAACVFAVGCVGDPFLHKQLPLVLLSFLAGLVAAGEATRERAEEDQGGSS